MIFDWRHIVVRNLLRDHKVKHIALDRRPFNGGTRIVGIPIDNHDRQKYIQVKRGHKRVWTPMTPIDLRIPVDSKEVDPESRHGEVLIIPDTEVRIRHRGDLLMRFVYPENIEEQLAAIYIPPFLRHTPSLDGNSQSAI